MMRFLPWTRKGPPLVQSIGVLLQCFPNQNSYFEQLINLLQWKPCETNNPRNGRHFELGFFELALRAIDLHHLLN